MSDALVLAGAVAKGAFTAGALAKLFDPKMKARLGLNVRRIVATSSGALNGAFLASRIADGSEAAGLPLLEELWQELGGFHDVFDVGLGAVARARGISTSKKLRALLERFIPPHTALRPIDLAVVITNLCGEVDIVGAELATTYERCLQFSADSFASPESLAAVFDAVVASAAFPIVFEPASVQLGMRNVQCIDGGVCNNTPLKYALAGEPDINRVFVIAPYPSVQISNGEFSGLGLLSRLGDVLMQERLFRDLREAHEVNRALRALERALPVTAIRDRALTALGWTDRRVVEIVEVRPNKDLEGDPFAGFLSKRLRGDYTRAGREAARAAVLGS